MTPISYFNLINGLGLPEYKAKALANIDLFTKIFNTTPEDLKSYFTLPVDKNYKTLERISFLTGIPIDVVEGINVIDETLNFQTDSWYACTSVGRKDRIGQTLDLYTVDLCVVREPDAIYLTMPPYLTLMGIGRDLAFCTNHLFSGVTEGKVPISYMRHELLHKSTLIEAMNYLDSIARRTSVNFLISDGQDVVDLEVSPEAVKIISPEKGFVAHTNHRVDPTFYRDKQCSRLSRAVELLEKNENIETILDDPEVYVPISYVNSPVGFGSIVQVIMNLKEKSISYKDSTMTKYHTIWL